MITHQGTQPLETARLLLRRAVQSDAQPMFENWAGDPEVTKYLTWPTHNSVEISRMVSDSWIADYEKPDTYLWMITLKGTPIGSISVVEQNSGIGKAEIGSCIGTAWWHQGIMSETLKAVMDFLFDEVGYHRVESLHDPNNPHSGAVMRKCGMQYEGTLRKYGWNNTGICDTCMYSVLAEDIRPSADPQ